MAQSQKRKSAKKTSKVSQTAKKAMKANTIVTGGGESGKGTISKPLAIMAILMLILLPLVAYYLINSYYAKSKVTYNDMYACEKCAVINEPLISPDGNYKLFVEYKTTNGGAWYFVPYVYDLDTDEVLLAGSAYENTNRVAYMWDESSRLWGYSDNKGFFYYGDSADSWELIEYKADNSEGLVLPLSFQNIDNPTIK